MVETDEKDFMGIENREIQRFEFVVHQGGQHGVTLAAAGIQGFGTDGIRKFLQRTAFRHIVISAVIAAKNLYHSFHKPKYTKLFPIFVL